jgi:hypothetical protein
MRLAALVFAVALLACAATKEQVTAALEDKYSGQSVDKLVVEFGPPINSFKMASGEVVYQWELANVTRIAGDQYSASARTYHCRVRAIVGRDNMVRSVSTEDVSNLYGESFCAKRLGLQRNT